MRSTPIPDIHFNDLVVDRCYLIARIGAVIVALSGAVGLLGWVLDNHALKALFTGTITMKTNAAVGLLIAGVVILLQMDDRPRPLWLCSVCRYLSLLLLLLGAATLIQHITGWNLHIDQLLFTEAPDQPATASPNRMGPPGSLSFILGGLCLFLHGVASPRAQRVAQNLALLIGVIALIPLIGYAYGVHPLYGISRYTGIALHTAVSLAVLSVAIVTARPHCGFMRLACADDAGGMMIRRMILPAILVPFLLGLLRASLERFHLIDEAFGRPMLVLALIIVFLAMIWWNARSMSQLNRARNRSEEARRMNADRLRLAIEAGRLAPWEYHGDRDEFWLSSEYAALLELAPREQICTLEECLQAAHPDERDMIRSRLFNALEHRHPYSIEHRILLPDNGVRWVSSRGDVMQDEHGKVVGLVGIAHDITARKQAEDAVNAARISAERSKEAAEAANSAKDRFLASLSHELRTPLTPVLTTAQMLEQTAELSAPIREQLAMIRRNVQLETRLIDDLLDLTRISRGKLALETAPVDLHQQVEHVIDICRSDIQSKQIQFNVSLMAAQSVVLADSPRLQQIFWNLIKNAVKFTPGGGRISIETRSLPQQQIEVRVIDSGLGIEPQNLTKIFDAFEQGGREVTRQFGGLGLGLAISKSLAELHHGSLRAESDGKGCGSTFILTLPLAANQAAPESAPGRDGHPLDLHNLRVLLVEDHADTGRAMCRLLKGFGCQVQSAQNVQSAVAVFIANDFDLLLSDLGLPDGTGYDLIRRVSEIRPIRAIALSGYGMEEDLRRSKEAGFIAHLTKPVDQDKLIRAIQAAMQSA